MKISLCCTVKNEDGNVEKFLKTILYQSRIPDEIIIVDGGSTDKTIEILQDYQARYLEFVRIIVEPGVNIAKGRNIAIKNAKYDYVSSADAGTEYDKDWFKNLCRPLEEDPTVDFVSGFWEPKAENLYEECVGILTYPASDLLEGDKFFPSARSVAFKKKVWEEIGGYAEYLPRGIGEDSLFDAEAQDRGYKIVLAKDATCYWRPRGDIIKLFKQYYFYSRGAAIGGISKQFVFSAHGSNPIQFTLRNLERIFQKRKIAPIAWSFLILETLLVAKITGTIMGKIQKTVVHPKA